MSKALTVERVAAMRAFYEEAGKETGGTQPLIDLCDTCESLRAQAALAEQHATEAEGHAETLLVENEALRKEADRLTWWILRIATVAEKHDHQIITLLCEQATEGLAADGEITEKLDRFHELQRIVDRYERGVWEITAPKGCSACDLNRMIRNNLLDGKEWDGKP